MPWHWAFATVALVFILPWAGCFRSPAVNISDWLRDCQSPSTSEARFVCRFNCPADDAVLAEALSPWWDIRFDYRMFNEMCERSADYHLAFQAVFRKGRLFYRSCSNSIEMENDAHGLLDFVLALSKFVGFPDVTFNFNVGDQPFTDKVYWSPVPQLHWVVAQGHWTIPLPTPQILSAFNDNMLGDNPDISSTHQNWHSRTAKAFWRGSLSIPDKTPYTLMGATPRVRLMRIAKERPDIFDVGITGFDEEIVRFFGKARGDTLRKTYLDSPILNFAKALPTYKYVLNVAAVLSSWRLPQLMASGALVFLQENSDMDLISAWMTPWVHFVPIRNDLADLVEKLDYMIAHDDEAQRIAKAGYEFFKENVTRANIACYLWRTIRSIADHSDLEEWAPPKPLYPYNAWTEVLKTSTLSYLESIGRSEL